MGHRRGFTIIELTIVIAIMAILLVLGVVSFRGMQSAARDKEREADIQAIAAYLESLYPREIRDGSTVIKPAGSYPSLETLSNTSYQTLIFNDLEMNATRAPETGGAMSFTGAPSGTVAPDKDHYIYEPLKLGAHRCLTVGDECRSFVLHYKLESGAVGRIESKNK